MARLAVVQTNFCTRQPIAITNLINSVSFNSFQNSMNCITGIFYHRLNHYSGRNLFQFRTEISLSNRWKINTLIHTWFCVHFILMLGAYLLNLFLLQCQWQRLSQLRISCVGPTFVRFHSATSVTPAGLFILLHVQQAQYNNYEYDYNNSNYHKGYYQSLVVIVVILR